MEAVCFLSLKIVFDIANIDFRCPKPCLAGVKSTFDNRKPGFAGAKSSLDSGKFDFAGVKNPFDNR